MANTTYGVNDALAVKLWSKTLAVEALKATEIAPLIGTSARSIIQKKTETQKGPGDKITFGLRMQLVGDGVSENEALEGNEEALTTFSDAVFINELDHAVRVPSNKKIDAQRVPFSLRSEAKDALVDWYAKRLSVSFFNQVCGNTAATSPKYTGLNAVTAPSATRHIYAGSASNDQGLTSADVFELRYIDYMKELAMTADPQIRPVRINGQDKYVCYLHPYQVTDLRTSTSTGQWLDITKAAYTGAMVSKNPIYTGALGEYNGVILRMSHDIPQGVNSATGVAVSNTRRAVLLGAQAAVCAYGQNGGDQMFTWVEELFDYQRWLGVSAQGIWGLKKAVFDSKDFGTVVLSTYAAAHS